MKEAFEYFSEINLCSEIISCYIRRNKFIRFFQLFYDVCLTPTFVVGSTTLVPLINLMIYSILYHARFLIRFLTLRTAVPCHTRAVHIDIEVCPFCPLAVYL